MLLLLVACAVSLLFRHPKSPIEYGIHPELVYFIQAGGNHNFLGQRIFHLVIAFSNLVGATAIHLWSLPQRLCMIVTKAYPIAVLALMLFIWVSFLYNWADYWLCLLLSPLILTKQFFSVLRWLSQMHFDAFCLLALIYVLCLSNMLVPFNFANLNQSTFAEIQSNYSLVVCQGDRLTAGQALFEQVHSIYGFLLPTLCGIWEKYLGYISWGNYIFLIRGLQLFFVLTALSLYLKHARHRLHATLLPLLMVVPWFNSNATSILFPNLSPWRLIVFPLYLLVLYATRRMTASRSFFLAGCASGLFLFINLESTLATICGTTIFLFFRFINKFNRQLFVYIATSFLGTAIAFVAFNSIVRLGLGYIPDFLSFFHGRLAVAKLVQTGLWGGFRIPFSPFAFFVLIVDSFVIWKITIMSQRKSASFRNCIRLSVATTSIIWLAYYFNRPAAWYLHAQYFFFGFFAIDIIRATELMLRRTSFSFPLAWAAKAFLAVIVVPTLIYCWKENEPQIMSLVSGIGHGHGEIVDGVLVASDQAKEARSKAAIIKQRSVRGGNFTYITAQTLLIPKLSGVAPATFMDDPYVELAFESDTDQFLKNLSQSNVLDVYVDAVDSNLVVGDEHRKRWLKGLKRRLLQKFPKETYEGGWCVLSR